jgi:hypothetical protein
LLLTELAPLEPPACPPDQLLFAVCVLAGSVRLGADSFRGFEVGTGWSAAKAGATAAIVNTEMIAETNRIMIAPAN